MKLAGRPSSSNILEETRPPRDLLDWLVEVPVYSANNWRNRLFPANVGLPRIDFSPASLQAGIDRDYGQRVAATNRDIIREAARNDIVPISKGDNLYMRGPDGKIVEGYDSPFFRQSIARAGGDAAPDLKSWHYVTSAANARKVPDVPVSAQSAAMQFSGQPAMTKAVIDTIIAEAGSDPEGLRAVAWVIQNRASQWGMTPEQVVKQAGQFEGYHNPGSSSRAAQKDAKVRAKAEAAWQAVTSGSVPDPTNGGTSFRAKGYKQPAPNGTVEIGGNVFALGSAKPNSALAAINTVAPTPMPSRPAALSAYMPTEPPKPRSYAPPGMKALTESNAAFGVLPFDRKPDPATFAPGMGIDLKARDLNPPMVPRVPAPPARGVGTSYLAPATNVATYKVDMNGNPIIPQAREPLPSERIIPSAVPALMAQANAAAALAPKMPAPAVQPPQLTAAQRSALASTGSTTPSVAPVPRTKPTFPVAVAQNGTYTPAPAPVDLLAKADQSRLPKGTYDPGGDAIMQALYPKPATPAAVAAINAATLPRLPMLPSPAMAAARLPTVPVRTAPIAPARTPLPQTRTVNPMTQIVPAVQARAGQGLLGGLLNMLTAGNVPQANTVPANFAAQVTRPSNIPGVQQFTGTVQQGQAGQNRFGSTARNELLALYT